MDRLRSRYIESLEFDKDQNKVRCQCCGNLCQVIRKDEFNVLDVPGRRQDRIYRLQKIIEQTKKYHIGCGRGVKSSRSSCKNEEAELKSLLDDERQRELLRRLPLYSNRMTGFKFLCSSYYDKLYYKVRIKCESPTT